MASEKLRQREVHKYYQAWLNSSFGFDSTPSNLVSHHNRDRSQIRLSKDKTLIAFAQLGCLKLNLKRCVVTLISTDQQYILAEATKSLSLVSGDGDSGAQDEIWFGNASLPRSQGISGDALFPPAYTTIGDDASPYTAPALVIPDITTHEAYCSRGYAGRGVSFYCGVPILTDSGVPIGVYTATDDNPRNGLKEAELRFLHDMASTVMRHLETVSNEAARFRGEAMVLGLGKFISGAATMEPEVANSKARYDQSAASGLGPMVENPSRVFKGMDITSARPSKSKSIMRVDKPQESTSSSVQTPTSPPLVLSNQRVLVAPKQAPFLTDSEHHLQAAGVQDGQLSVQAPGHPAVAPQPYPKFDSIFLRAATILQECVSADGVLFFDAIPSNATRRRTISSPNPYNEHIDIQRCPHEHANRKNLHNPLLSEQANTSVDHGVSEESDIGSPKNEDRKMCKLLGCAFGEPSQDVRQPDIPDNVDLTVRTLSKLIKLYPQGKLFSPHAGGGHSESEGERLTETTSGGSDPNETDRVAPFKKSQRLPRTIAKELDRLVSHAQNVVWLPLWDFAKQRWSAGLFLWSKRVDRLVTAQEDLIYLKAFGNSVMVEVARRDAAMADTAKATFIANISHELRTPLHGILGNLEILQDTSLTEFQHSLVTAIELCGRTLSDTIDHVLDYSKINQLSMSSSRRDRSSPMPLSSADLTSNHSGAPSTIEEDFDLAAIVEEAIEAAYASHTFQSSGRTKLRNSSITAEQQATALPIPVERLRDVQVIVRLEYQRNWLVHSQPSAIRRVVTNLFGNALKYTESGTIQVTLSTREPAGTPTSASAIAVLLSIKDTGRGMSAEFVRDRAFVPFSQESQFSTGTGLGLSIVQLIVRSLGGEVELESDQGTGTEIKVLLNLPLATHRAGELSQLHLPFSNTTGLSLRILPGGAIEAGRTPHGLLSATSSLATIAKQWFGMDIVDSHSHAKSDFIIYMTPPALKPLQQIRGASRGSLPVQIIVLAANTIEKAHLATKYSEISRQEGLRISVLSHPIGPFKFGKIISDQMDSARETDVSAGQNGADQDVIMSESASLSINGGPSSPSLFGINSTDSQEMRGLDIQLPHDEGSSKKRPRVTLERTSFSAPPVKKVDGDTMKQTPDAPELHAEKEGNLSTKNGSPKPPFVSTPLSPTRAIVDVEQRLRVLLVDDNDINLSLLKTCMKRAHIPFDSAKDGLQATLAFENASSSNVPFSHVLMDISMPVMDGIQATREIRDFERRQQSMFRATTRPTGPEDALTPTADSDMGNSGTAVETQRAIIMALSGVAAEATQNEMLEAGADLFLPKPVKMKELVNMLRS